MKVKITYTDNESLSPEEIIETSKHLFGSDVQVSILPNNETADGYLYLAIQKLITEEQLHSFYDDGKYLYDESITRLKIKTLREVEQVIDRVIKDNELRIR